MRALNETRPMFGGLARRSGWKDAAVVALWLALVAGFVAEVTPPGAPAGPAEPVFASAAPGDCPDHHPTERAPRPVVLVEMIRYP